ncbi:MAG: M28 family peptidase [Gemmatimonadetes bacterium]|nr:M28 family peptidase [Gemmatimonadota bacterium]
MRLQLTYLPTLVACLPLAVSAQGRGSREIPAAMSLIREADLKRDLYAMAGPAMRGREGGTLDEMTASAWVAEQYRKIGLVPAGEGGTWYQWFNLTRTRVSTVTSSVALNGRAVGLFQDIIPLGTVPVEAGGPVYWLADASDTTVNIRGRVVATPVVVPAPANIRSTSYTFAVRYTDAALNATTNRLARRGAAAIIIVPDARVDSAFDAMVAARSRGGYDVANAMPRTGGPPRPIGPVPALGTGQTPAFLVRASMGAMLRDTPMSTIKVQLERFETPSVNVIGMVRGTDPKLRDEYLIYSSHQDANGVRATLEGDSVHAGADDNGSVTVAHLAAARAFVRQPGKRSVLFINHGSEERGLLGSRYHIAHPVVPVSQMVAVLNGDMIGRNHPDSASVLGAQPPHRNSTTLVEMALRANALTGKFTLDSLWDRPTHPEGWYFRSDHVPYARANVPALMYTTNLHDDYHTPRDTPERIDYPKLTRMAQWMYLTGWFVANAPQRPGIDPGFKLER